MAEEPQQISKEPQQVTKEPQIRRSHESTTSKNHNE